MEYSNPEDIMTAALAYHKKGWDVIAQTPPKDNLKSWLRATYAKLNYNANDRLFVSRFNASPEHLKRYFKKRPNAGLAIVTGKKSGIVVVDIDTPHGGDETLATLNLPKTLTVKTPNGLHLYYEYPQDMFIGSVFRLLKGIDIKAENGSVNAPPTRSADGVPYCWEDAHAPMQPLPNVIIEHCKTANCMSLAAHYCLTLRRKYYDYAVHRLLDILLNHHPK